MFSTLSATFHDAIVPTAIGHGIIHVDLMKNNYLYQQLDPKWQIQHFADKLYYWQIPQLAEFHCSSLSLSLTHSIHHFSSTGTCKRKGGKGESCAAYYTCGTCQDGLDCILDKPLSVSPIKTKRRVAYIPATCQTRNNRAPGAIHKWRVKQPLVIQQTQC